MRIERLGDVGSAADVLRALAGAAARRGLPPPAALVGDWFDSAAVVAPSVAIVPTDPREVFAVAPGERTATPSAAAGSGTCPTPTPAADGRGPRIPEAAGGWTDCVLRLDADGRWWYESLSGATIQPWLAGTALAIRTGPRTLRNRLAATGFRRAPGRGPGLPGGDRRRGGATRRACAPSSPGRSPGRRWTSSPTAVTRTSPRRARRICPATGVRWRRCRPSCSCAGAGDQVTSSPIKGTLPLHAEPTGCGPRSRTWPRTS